MMWCLTLWTTEWELELLKSILSSRFEIPGYFAEDWWLMSLYLQIQYVQFPTCITFASTSRRDQDELGLRQHSSQMLIDIGILYSAFRAVSARRLLELTTHARRRIVPFSWSRSEMAITDVAIPFLPAAKPAAGLHAAFYHQKPSCQFLRCCSI